MSRTVSLFVRNERDDFICNISISPTHEVLDATITKLTITSYTRNESILQSRENNCSVSVTDGGKNKHFDGFVKYLFDRKKAAEAMLPSGAKFYLLPPAIPTSTSLAVTIITTSQPKAASNSYAPAPSSGPTKTPPAPAKASSGGFLNSLLGKVDSTASTRAAAPVVTPQINTLHALQERISSELAAFVADTSATMKAFEPMEREQRQIVHEATNDYNEVLISSSLGDDLDRHVVVYKRGHEPQDVDFFAGLKQTHKPVIRKKAPTSTFRPLEVKALESNLQAVNTVKRDRRTIEEVQQELKKRKVEES